MRFLIRSLTGLFLLAATLGLLAFAAYTVERAVSARLAETNRPGQARERVFAVNVVTVESGAVTPLLTAFGQVQSRRTQELRAPAAGRIVELAEEFEDGGAVAAGQLLLRIDPSAAEAALALSRTALMAAEAELAEAGRATGIAADDLAVAEAQRVLRDQALERQRGLGERGLGTAAEREAAELAASSAAQAVLSKRQALASAEARRDAAETALARVRIELAEAGRDLAETALHANFAGVLSEVTAVEGGMVSPNEKLAVLIDPEALEVSFRVSTTQYARLIDGRGALLPVPVRAEIDVFGTGLAATGRLSRVGAAVGEGMTGRVIFAGLDAAPGFRPGDFVTVSIEEPVLEEVALLPAAAVDAAGTVLALGPQERLEQVAVQVLRRQGDAVIVSAPLLEGREVVAERSPLLGAGIRVRPLRPGGEAEAVAAADPEAGEVVELTPERRAQLVAFIEASAMPEEARARVLDQLAQERVPAQVVARIEARMGG